MISPTSVCNNNIIPRFPLRVHNVLTSVRYKSPPPSDSWSGHFHEMDLGHGGAVGSSRSKTFQMLYSNGRAVSSLMVTAVAVTHIHTLCISNTRYTGWSECHATQKKVQNYNDSHLIFKIWPKRHILNIANNFKWNTTGLFFRRSLHVKKISLYSI